MSSSPSDALASLDAAGLLRTLRPLESPAGTRVIRGGRELWNFASNDYLGLSQHQALADAFIEGIRRYGCGATASRLVCGTLSPHKELEEWLADAKGTSAAISFSSGFAAATGCLPALVGRGDFLILDKLCHASLIDGARLSGATVRVFPHNDVRKLGKLLTGIREKNPQARIVVVTESVFSMDGDLCPLREITELKDDHGALLFLDEAHGFGVLGETGMGLAEREKLSSRVDFQMGTLGKAGGLAGAYVACSADWRELLVNRARSFIYSTAPPPALAHAALTAVRLIRSNEGHHRRNALRERIDEISPGHPSPVVPFVIGPNQETLATAARLETEGFLVPAIRYPTVPRGTARLRISLSASHPAGIPQKLGKLLSAAASGKPGG